MTSELFMLGDSGGDALLTVHQTHTHIQICVCATDGLSNSKRGLRHDEGRAARH